MYVTMAEIVLLMDVVRASTLIADRAGIFGYDKESRTALHKRLMARMDESHIIVASKEADDE